MWKLKLRKTKHLPRTTPLVMTKLRSEHRLASGSASSHPRATGNSPAISGLLSVGSEPQRGEGKWKVVISNPIFPPKSHLPVPHVGNLPLDSLLPTKIALLIQSHPLSPPPSSWLTCFYQQNTHLTKSLSPLSHLWLYPSTPFSPHPIICHLSHLSPDSQSQFYLYVQLSLLLTCTTNDPFLWSPPGFLLSTSLHPLPPDSTFWSQFWSSPSVVPKVNTIESQTPDIRWLALPLPLQPVPLLPSQNEHLFMPSDPQPLCFCLLPSVWNSPATPLSLHDSHFLTPFFLWQNKESNS